MHKIVRPILAAYQNFNHFVRLSLIIGLFVCFGKMPLLRPKLPADENFVYVFSLFFVLSYVGYVPSSDDLGIC